MKTFKILLSIFIISIYFLSCDKIEEPYKEVVEKPETEKKVLLEDYTGHTCVFCPAAQEIAHELSEIYEENLIVVAIHAGWQSNPQSSGHYTYNFQTDAGTAYFNDFLGANVGTPNGLVDRINTDGDYVKPPANWGTEVASQIEEENKVNIEITTEFNNNEISGNVKLDFIGDVNFQTNLQIWVTEDSIIKPQTVPSSEGGIIEDYVHNHVLRGAINGTWGEALPSDSYSTNDEESISISNYELGDDWVPKQLSIIAFLYNQETKQVLQVEKVKLIQ